MIDYEMLEEEWDDIPAVEKIQRNVRGGMDAHPDKLPKNKDTYKKMRQLKEGARVGW
jgi:hypothetical protein